MYKTSTIDKQCKYSKRQSHQSPDLWISLPAYEMSLLLGKQFVCVCSLEGAALAAGNWLWTRFHLPRRKVRCDSGAVSLHSTLPVAGASSLLVARPSCGPPGNRGGKKKLTDWFGSKQELFFLRTLTHAYRRRIYLHTVIDPFRLYIAAQVRVIFICFKWVAWPTIERGGESFS